MVKVPKEHVSKQAAKNWAAERYKKQKARESSCVSPSTTDVHSESQGLDNLLGEMADGFFEFPNEVTQEPVNINQGLVDDIVEKLPEIQILIKDKEVEEIISGLAIDVKLIPRDRLDSAVVKWQKRNGYPWLAWLADVSETTADRWTINYVRHSLTEYENDFKKMLAEKVGHSTAHEIIRSKILNRIAAVYPHLKFECHRQLTALVPVEAEQETDQLLELLSELKVEITVISRDRLDVAVVLERKKKGYPGLAWLADVPESTADRWMVNYIRHNLTQYDKIIERVLVDRVGREAGHALLKSKVLNQIAKVYPELKYECQRQLDLVWEKG